MLLPGALFILFLAGCWLLCLTDVATTPAAEFPGLSKRGWIALIAVTFTVGAVAWYATRTRRRLRCWPQILASHVTTGSYRYGAGLDQGRPMTAEAALARHPASQARRADGPVRPGPIGPDDDPEFLHMLDRLINGSSDSSELPEACAFLTKACQRHTRPARLKSQGARGTADLRGSRMRRVGLAAILAAGGLAAFYLLGAGHNPSRSATTGGGPRTAAAPRTAARPPASAPSSGSGSCTSPRYTTSNPTWWNLAPYFVANDMWNVTGYRVSETLYACSYSNWYVVATMDNSKGDGAVKTYPNSHRDFDSNPEISSFSSITSTFAETGPDRGIYEDAYDIWLNGIATAGSTEVMIWTRNHGQTPAGSLQATVTIDGRSYAVWKTGTYIAFVAGTSFTSGTVNLLDFFQWLMTKGWIPGDTTLGQVDYGAELVSTNGVPATFAFSDFSVNAS